MENQWNLEEPLSRLISFRDKRDWKRFHHPKELAAALAIEAAELQEHFLWKPSESPEEVLSDLKRKDVIEEEVADIGIYLLLFSDSMGINLREVIERKIEDYERRYTVEAHKGIAQKAVH